MKPASFDYRRAGSVGEAVDLLAEHGDHARVLAGGQSLLLEMRYRAVRPEVLIDINPAAGLAGAMRAEGRLRIGALVRHADLERAPGTDPLARLLAMTARFVAHPPIRARGTFAGSVAWAHPAAEWCALVAALDGEITLASADGRRTVPAARWFRGRHRTDRAAGELVTAVELPVLPPGAGVAFAEHRRTSASFPMVAVLAVLEVAHGEVSRARIGLANGAEVPVRAVAAEAAVSGGPPSPARFAAAADVAAATADPPPEPHCSPAYRRQVVRVLVRRALARAWEDAA